MSACLDAEKKAQQSIRIYNRLSLYFYDIYVHGFVAPSIFKCKTANILDLYRQNTSSQHLEAGVGTAYLLMKSRVLDKIHNLAILDMNKDCLAFSRQKLKEVNPQLFQVNLLESFAGHDMYYDSIAINYVLHCIPGNFTEKAVVFSNLKAHMSSKGILFGSTVLFPDPATSRFAHRLVSIYNQSGVFNNRQDDEAGLLQALRANFSQVECRQIGDIAIFRASDRALD